MYIVIDFTITRVPQPLPFPLLPFNLIGIHFRFSPDFIHWFLPCSSVALVFYHLQQGLDKVIPAICCEK